jgi:hypothetical protein
LKNRFLDQKSIGPNFQVITVAEIWTKQVMRRLFIFVLNAHIKKRDWLRGLTLKSPCVGHGYMG